MIGNLRTGLFHFRKISVCMASVVIAILFLCVTSIFSGCGSDPQVLSPAKTLNEDRCDELIKSVLDMLQPDRFDITSDSEAVVGVLNQWSSNCAASIEESDSVKPEVMALLNGIISPDEFNLSSKSNYHKRDVEHVRDCLLYKELVDSALKAADTDLGRSVELFEFVTRNIALLPKAEQQVPLTPFEIILFGRGTSEDRAWIFVNLLRQLRIDAVILRPRRMQAAPDAGQKEQNGKSLPQSHWLVGALLDDEVYLFDMRLGLPIPSIHDDGKSVTVRTPATLSEVLTSDEGFRKLDIDPENSYPLKSSDFNNLHVDFIANGSFWFPKMKRLQMSLTGESVLIYDGLEDGENGDGLFSRIAKQGKGRWTRGDIFFWPYPEQALQNSAVLAGIQRQKLRELHRPFDAPIEMTAKTERNQAVVNEKTGQLLLDQPSRKQLKARIDHIMGRFDKAIRQYQLLRVLELTLPPDVPVSPEILQTHGRAEEDAFFWTGVCQIEQGEFSAGAETLHRYIIRNARGAWINQAVYLRSLSAAESDKLLVALQFLNQKLNQELEQDSIDPFVRLKYQFLVNRWRTLSTLRQSTPTQTNE